MRKILLATFLFFITSCIAIGVVFFLKMGHTATTLSFTECDDLPEGLKITLLSEDEPDLIEVRRLLELDAVVAGCKGDLCKTKKVATFVSELWEHDSLGLSNTGNPLEVVKGVLSGKRYCCVEYANVLRACLVSLGIPARVLALATKDVETRKKDAGHVVVEAYIKDLKKWVMVDGQFGVVCVDAGSGIPLNAVELQGALSEGKNIMVDGITSSSQEYLTFIAPYLYHFTTSTKGNIERNPNVARITLLPCGAKEITHFQGQKIPGKTIFINSKKVFYQEPFV